MEFRKVWKDIQNKNARKKGVKAYYNSGQVYFSRLFGYERFEDKYIPIPKYSDAIKKIYDMLIGGLSLPEIKKELDLTGHRDSSNNKYSFDRICSVIRPIYAGYLHQGLKLIQINNIEPLITIHVYNSALKALKHQIKKTAEV